MRSSHFILSIFGAAILIYLLGGISLTSAQSIVGISPGRHEFDNVLRGGYAERPFVISLSTDDPVEVSVEPGGDIADWIFFEETNAIVSKSDPWTMIVSVQPPTDIPNGNYSGFIRVSTSALEPEIEEGHATGNIIAVLDVVISVEIVDAELISCTAGKFRVDDAEKGDNIVFYADVLNTGNVRLQPNIVVDIWDQDQITIVHTESFFGDEILPTREESFEFTLSSDEFDTDQYWVDIHAVDCFNSDTLTFDVLEPGTLKAQGILTDIISPPVTEVGETISVVAVFENVGEKAVDARFRGQVMLDDTIVQVFESEEARVGLADFVNFSMFFTPQKPGRYIISGRVFYDKKRTFESSRVLTVLGPLISFKSIGLFVFYIIVALVISFLFIKIRKERRRHYGR